MLRIAAIALALTGCASLRPNAGEWTDHERYAFALSIAAHAADIATTQSALDRGCVEGNPLYGPSPDIGSVIAVKALVLGLQYAIYNSPNMGENTHVYGYIAAAITGGVAIWNSRQDCYD